MGARHALALTGLKQAISGPGVVAAPGVDGQVLLSSLIN